MNDSEDFGLKIQVCMAKFSFGQQGNAAFVISSKKKLIQTNKSTS